MPFAQPPLNTNAQGLHVPRSWAWEPIEGQAGRKPDAQSACFVGHAEVLSIETPWLGASSMGLGHCAPAAVIHAGEPSLFGEAPPSVVARSIVSAVLISEVTSASANDGGWPEARAPAEYLSWDVQSALGVGIDIAWRWIGPEPPKCRGNTWNRGATNQTLFANTTKARANHVSRDMRAEDGHIV
eukprot:CAMPEP_0115703164 /NCGR_PEP_ID=MMETSP0272-20121206/68946_1 /TAXON_ID=71861 /ORGANISM="Scrippsiella trochoidea, Strain CCMP3099" /LENGTH=184 /DNA_ID=CAMNT_0003143997 /DNA_START=352 /DNA_END=905 /DNA_ORIENTATION=-